MPDRNARIILQLVDQLSPGILGAVGGVGTLSAALDVATVAIGTLKAAFEFGAEGARVQVIAERFDSLSKAANTSGDAMLQALRKASGNQISDLNLQLTANRAQLLGVAHDAQTFGQLMAIARDRGQEFGTTTEKAFNDIVTGIGRASPRILDNLGIIISEKEAYDAYAKSIGVAASTLTKAQKEQAILNAVLKEGETSIKATGGAVDGNSAAFARGGAALENVKNAAATFAANGLAPIAAQFAETTEKTQEFIDYMGQAKQAFIEFTGINKTSGGGGGTFEFAPPQTDNDVEQRRIEQLALMHQQAARAIRDTTAAIDGSLRSSVADTAAKDAQQAKTELLTRESNNAANAFREMNPRIDEAGVLALVAAGKLDPLIGQLVILQGEAGKARDKLIDLNNAEAQGKLDKLITLRAASGTSSGRGGGSDAAAEGQAFVDSLQKQNREASNLRDSEIAIARAKKDTGREIDLLRQKQAGLDRTTADGQAAYNNIEAQIISIQNQKNTSLEKGLRLQESTYDSQQKQLKAAIDLGVAEARNRLDTLKDQDELKKANAILASSATSADLKARAAAKRDLILAEENKRNFDIGQKETTENGTIINGKLYQSVPGGKPVQALTVGSAPTPVQVAAAASPTTAGRPLVITMDGKVVASIILPYAWAELDGAIQHQAIIQGARA